MSADPQNGFDDIRYHEKNRAQAQEVHDALVSHGHSVIDLDTALSEDVGKIAAAIDASYAVIVGCSSWFQDIDNVSNCRAIVETASRKRRHLVPVIFEDGFLPDSWLLVRVAGLESVLLTDADVNTASLRKLRGRLDTLRDELGITATAAAPAPTYVKSPSLQALHFLQTSSLLNLPMH